MSSPQFRFGSPTRQASGAPMLTRIRTRLARSISDAAWGELLRQLAYKASWYGRTFWQAPKNFASSKLLLAGLAATQSGTAGLAGR